MVDNPASPCLCEDALKQTTVERGVKWPPPSKAPQSEMHPLLVAFALKPENTIGNEISILVRVPSDATGRKLRRKMISWRFISKWPAVLSP